MSDVYFTVRKARGFRRMHSFHAGLGTKQQQAHLLDNVARALSQVFGRRAARRAVQAEFGFKPKKGKVAA